MNSKEIENDLDKIITVINDRLNYYFEPCSIGNLVKKIFI